MDAEDIRARLESEYDIPFTVLETTERGEPAFIMGPEDPGKELFSIQVSFRNAIRLNMDVVFHKYSATFLAGLAHQSAENRSRFDGYRNLIREKGAKLTIRVNGDPFPEAEESIWPAAWHNLQVHVTRMPVVEQGELDYGAAAWEWGSLLMGMILSLADIVPLEEVKEIQPVSLGHTEGTAYRTNSIRYERNPLNRKLCLAAKGWNCAVCGMNFEQRYGPLGKDYIQVHHLVPVSRLGPAYQLDPIHDLIPVCANCHVMLHRQDPPLSPEQLTALLRFV